MFLLDELSDSFVGFFFYLTDKSGRLCNAVYFDEEPEEIHEPEKRFEHELQFWKQWQRETLKSLVGERC